MNGELFLKVCSENERLARIEVFPHSIRFSRQRKRRKYPPRQNCPRQLQRHHKPNIPDAEAPAAVNGDADDREIKTRKGQAARCTARNIEEMRSKDWGEKMVCLLSQQMSGITSLQNVAPKERQSARETDRETETHRGWREREREGERVVVVVVGVLVWGFVFRERGGGRGGREKERQTDPETERGRYRQKKRLTNEGTKRGRNIERGRERLTETECESGGNREKCTF